MFYICLQKLRTHWAGIKEHVASFDEIDMSTTRLRLRLPDEPVPETPQLNILERSEVRQLIEPNSVNSFPDTEYILYLSCLQLLKTLWLTLSLIRQFCSRRL